MDRDSVMPSASAGYRDSSEHPTNMTLSPPKLETRVETEAGNRDRARRWLGIALVLGATLSFSLAGLFVRWVESADAWQTIFFRCVALAVALLGFSVIRHRGAQAIVNLRNFGPQALAGALLMGGAMIVVIWAFRNTTIANVVFIGGATPFVASLVAWLVLRERVARQTMIAMAAAFIGVAFMTADGLAKGTIIGDAFALAATLIFSSLVVVLRSGRSHDMLPVIAFGAMLAASFAAAMAPTLTVTAHDLMILVAMGGVQTSLSYALLAFGARYVSAAEVTLLGMAEIVLAPLWAWLALGETPSIGSLIGGGIILAAVLAQAAVRMQAEHR
ncbi:MAG: DMT family transporter [Alphaproteobacteria bacterium]|nr:DMT family transporter [Alphaproteobacteria bacterium]